MRMSMSRLGRLIAAIAITGAGCGSATSSAAPPASVAPVTAAATSAASAASVAPPTASPVASTAASGLISSRPAGDWPPEWQTAICKARAQLLRDDAKSGGAAGEDAATQAIADLRSTTINWAPGADLRSLLGKAAFILLDAAPRGGTAMNDVPPAIQAFQTAYDDLKAATGFECP
jgi:hypothetical protein